MTEPALVSSLLGAVANLAMPKSVTLARPALVNMMLPGLMSRWMTPSTWAKLSASATSAAISAARRGWSGPSDLSTSATDGPSMYSMTMKYVPPCSPQS